MSKKNRDIALKNYLIKDNFKLPRRLEKDTIIEEYSQRKLIELTIQDAVRLQDQGSFDIAYKLFKSVMEFDDKGFYYLGLLRLEEGFYQKAEYWFKEGAKKNQLDSLSQKHRKCDH